MATSPLLTLLTDFGLQDIYVGVMKGVIAQIAPAVRVIDLTHQIPPHNVAAARFNLMAAYSYFPTGTVHVAVVDPGVGGGRRAIALQLIDGFLIGPDNGLFPDLLEQHPILKAVELTNRAYWRTPNPSHTFHGRDIFAPVGAHLANGVAIEELGVAIEPDSLVCLPLGEWSQKDGIITGCIQYIDHFGNLVTNVPGKVVQGKQWSARFGRTMVPGSRSYSDCEIGSLLALVGSHGWIEIAVNSGSAWSKLRMNWGDPVQVMLKD
jgi:S-adenosylmethionine hydrolase